RPQAVGRLRPLAGRWLTDAEGGNEERSRGRVIPLDSALVVDERISGLGGRGRGEGRSTQALAGRRWGIVTRAVRLLIVRPASGAPEGAAGVSPCGTRR